MRSKLDGTHAGFPPYDIAVNVRLRAAEGGDQPSRVIWRIDHNPRPNQMCALRFRRAQLEASPAEIRVTKLTLSCNTLFITLL